MKKPSVAIYSGDIPSTTFIENLVHAVSQAGFRVYLFGKRKKKIEYTHPNIQIFSTPTNKFAFGLWLGWHSIILAITNPEKHRKLNGFVISQIKQGKNPSLVRGKYLPVFLHTPDIFHVQWGKSAADWAPVGELLGMKLILSFRGAHINYSPLADSVLADTYRRVFPSYHAFHAVSNAIATEGKKYISGETEVRVIHSGINSGVAQFIGKKEMAGKKSNTLRILSVGRFHWKKGYPIAFEAISKLVAKGFNLKYELVAGGDNEEAVYLVHDMNLQDHVVFHRAIPHNKVFGLMAECDLLLLPSVEEGIANVVLEAMAVGLPVLSSDCGGMAEAVQDGTTGLLFRNRDSDHLASKIREFSEMSSERKSEMIKAAQRNIMENFSMDSLGTEMVGLYKDVLKSPQGS